MPKYPSRAHIQTPLLRLLSTEITSKPGCRKTTQNLWSQDLTVQVAQTIKTNHCLTQMKTLTHTTTQRPLCFVHHQPTNAQRTNSNPNQPGQIQDRQLEGLSSLTDAYQPKIMSTLDQSCPPPLTNQLSNQENKQPNYPPNPAKSLKTNHQRN